MFSRCDILILYVNSICVTLPTDSSTLDEAPSPRPLPYQMSVPYVHYSRLTKCHGLWKSLHIPPERFTTVFWSPCQRMRSGGGKSCNGEGGIYLGKVPLRLVLPCTWIERVISVGIVLLKKLRNFKNHH